MKPKSIKLDMTSLLVGAAAGAGFMLARQMLAGKEPEKLPIQKLINRALDRTLQSAREAGVIRLEGDYRYVIFSDHHRGGRMKNADDFMPCEATYLGALDHYFDTGYKLITLGDAEELWEERAPTVMKSYEGVFRSEARFHPDRYIRIHGNHDTAWHSETLIATYLAPFFPDVKFRPGLLFQVISKAGSDLGEILLAHGHQGSLDSDILDFFPPLLLPAFRELQRYTGWFKNTPAKDVYLRGAFDAQLYRWVKKKERMLLIAGHTHRPVWSSMTHLEKLAWQLLALRQIPMDQRPPDYAEQVAQLQLAIREREEKYPSGGDMIKVRPCYFNTGCCCFKDGDITGIELESGVMRLIKWGLESGRLEKTVLEEAPLTDIFAMLDPKSSLEAVRIMPLEYPDPS